MHIFTLRSRFGRAGRVAIVGSALAGLAAAGIGVSTASASSPHPLVTRREPGHVHLASRAGAGFHRVTTPPLVHLTGNGRGSASRSTSAVASPATATSAAAAPANNDGPWALESFAGNVQQNAISKYGNDQDILPPDDTLAVGPNVILEANNSRLIGYDRAQPPHIVFDGDINTFVNPPSGYDVTDPRVGYDSVSGRFFFSIMAYDPNTCDSYVALYTSPASGTLTDSWYGIEVADAQSGTSGDQPSLGFSDNVVTIGWNLWNCSGAGTIGNPWGNELAFVQKSDLLAGTATSGSVYTTTSNGDWSTQPVQPTGGDGVQYVVENGSDVEGPHGSSNPPDLNYIFVYTITGTPDASTISMSGGGQATIHETWQPDPVPQLGTTVTLDPGDDHFLNAVYHAGNIWTAATTTCSGSAGGAGCLDYVNVTMSGTTLVGDHQLPFIGAGSSTWLFYPAVAVNNQGRMFTVFNESSSTQYPSVMAAALQSANGANSLTDYTTVAASATYYDPGMTPPARWGDYNGAAIDPAHPSDVWVVGEDIENVPGCGTSCDCPQTSACWSTHLAWLTGLGGYFMDGSGGVHPFGGASALPPSNLYWPNQDIVRGMALRADRQSGYFVDAYGGVHVFGAAPAETGSDYWQNWDIVRGIVLNPCDSSGTSGYVLDGLGGIHPFNGAPAVGTGPYWNFDIARGMTATCTAGKVSGFVLDGYGGINPWAQTGAAAPSAPYDNLYDPGRDIARGIVAVSAGTGYVLDGYGGIHEYGGTTAGSDSVYTPGSDEFRGLTYVPALHGGVVLDEYGGLHPWSVNGYPAFPPPPDPAHWSFPIARAVAE